MRPIVMSVMLMLASVSAYGQVVFDECFSDSTLRLDYVFGADAERVSVQLDKQVKMPGWAGRRNYLTEVPYATTGMISVIDAASGHTIYRNSFSSLFKEWLETEERNERARAFQNSFLVPLPKAEAVVSVELTDARFRPIARMEHRYKPGDVLVEKRGGKNVEHRYLHKGGDVAHAIDVAILPEGYTEAEKDSFYVHAQTAADEILRYEPFNKHPEKWNFVAVWVPSEDSGVSVPRIGEWKNTPFSSHFSTFYSDRYLTTDRLQDVHDALASVPYEHIIILANTEEYGGGGIYNSYMLTSSRHSTFKPVCVHEFGHSFGGLGDEYFYEGDVMEDAYPHDVEPWEPNITTLVDFDSKWKKLLPEGTPVPTPKEDADKYAIGVFEGGGYSAKGVYRPADECRMRNNTYPKFCAACSAALERLIEFYTR